MKLIYIVVFLVLVAVIEAAKGKLKYPGSCKTTKLVKFAEKCGCLVTPGANHLLVKDPKTGVTLTVIPHTTKENPTCQNIINILNGRCT
ncbi:hypothetical protein DPMN_037785 [Dreissena polymorpha]|uniref:Uncharacterized protein n=1 Tax=Dreissena polymorpha TaxID=45954 RepID=A0A9D4ME73_DREPO|nr:hypothetical protein DPMN_037785 [Dreissena polymorpha]